MWWFENMKNPPTASCAPSQTIESFEMGMEMVGMHIWLVRWKWWAWSIPYGLLWSITLERMIRWRTVKSLWNHIGKAYLPVTKLVKTDMVVMVQIANNHWGPNFGPLRNRLTIWDHEHHFREVTCSKFSSVSTRTPPSFNCSPVVFPSTNTSTITRVTKSLESRPIISAKCRASKVRMEEKS